MSSIAKTIALLLVSQVLGFGCGGEQVPGQSCTDALQCGPAGDALCVSGVCQLFDDQSGFGSVKVNLSFPSELYQGAASGYIRVFHRKSADGGQLSCTGISGGTLDLQGANLNLLQIEPKYLEFHWSSGGTFFPNNLVQLIRPDSDALMVADAYQGRNGEGGRTALGCLEGLQVSKDQVSEATVSLQAAGGP